MSKTRKKATAKAMEQLEAQLSKLPVNERAEFAQALACLGIGMVRGLHGDKFAAGFLQGALNDVNQAAGVVVVPPQWH